MTLQTMSGGTMLASCFLLGLVLSATSEQCSSIISFFISTPPYLEGLRGSCVLIPCNFSITGGFTLDHSSPIDAIWIVNRSRDEVFVFNSRNQKNKYPMTLIGNMSENNCSTLFENLEPTYTNEYVFRIENVNYNSYACDRLQINITDSPRKPMVNISGLLLENETVIITCSAATPCPQSPPTLTWNLGPEPETIRDQSSDGTFISKIKRKITLSDQHDGLTILCKASYPVKPGEEEKLSESNLTLSVPYSPKDTRAGASPSAEVSAGTLVELRCSSRANPPISLFTWFRVSSEGAVNVSVGDVFALNVTEGGEYFCEARNQLGAAASQRIALTVSGTLEVSVFWSIVIAGSVGLVLLVCLVVYFCWLRWLARTQKQTDTVLVNGEHSVNEDIHYGEIHFDKRTPESVEVFGGPEETVYSQIRVARAADASAAGQAKMDS